MAYNIIYKGHCDYTGNYWHMGECIRAWFYYDEEDFCYKLTNKATKEAIKSYNEFYQLLDNNY